jgi:hypothetical protein
MVLKVTKSVNFVTGLEGGGPIEASYHKKNFQNFFDKRKKCLKQCFGCFLACKKGQKHQKIFDFSSKIFYVCRKILKKLFAITCLNRPSPFKYAF